MPERWNRRVPPAILERDVPVMVQAVQAKKHVTVFSRKPTAEGAGTPIYKEAFKECCKLTRNEKDRQTRNDIISNCLTKKQQAGELPIHMDTIRPSRGAYAQDLNGKPGLKGKSWVNGKLVDAEGNPVRESASPETDYGLTQTVPVTTETIPVTTPTDAQVEALLCEYSGQLNEVSQLVSDGRFDEAQMVIQDMRNDSDCEVCHEVLDEVTAANKAAHGGDSAALAVLKTKIQWAKDSFCPPEQ